MMLKSDAYLNQGIRLATGPTHVDKNDKELLFLLFVFCDPMI